MNPWVETPSQAYAFVEALIGWEELSEESSRPFSPHALTAIKQYLGVDGVPLPGETWSLAQGIIPGSHQVQKMKNLATLLSSVGETILQNLNP